MTSGAPFPHLRRDLPPHCRFQIRTDPSWYDGRASTRLSQISVPHGSQTRKPESLNVTKTLRGNLVPADHLYCPTWQHFHFTTDLPQLTAFTPPFSRPGASRFSPHDRHTKPCLRSDWARREADPNRPPSPLPMRSKCACSNRAWKGTGFVEILFTTRLSTISRGSTHDAQQKCHSSPE